MRINVVVGNPPYQDKNKSIYHEFIRLSMRLKSSHIVMIVKNNLLTSTNMQDTRNEVIGYGLSEIVNYGVVGEIFNELMVSVCIIRIQRNKSSKQLCKITNIENDKVADKFIAELEVGIPCIRTKQIEWDIISKARQLNEDTFSSKVYPAECFRINSNLTARRDAEKVDIEYRDTKTAEFNIAVACMSERRQLCYKYIREQDIYSRHELLNLYKVICGEKLTIGKKVITNINIIGPGEICSGSWVLLYTCKTLNEAEDVKSYIQTKFFRYLVSLMLDGHMTGHSHQKYGLIPLQNFNKRWTDDELYKKYKLTNDEILVIENSIQ